MRKKVFQTKDFFFIQRLRESLGFPVDFTKRDPVYIHILTSTTIAPYNRFSFVLKQQSPKFVITIHLIFTGCNRIRSTFKNIYVFRYFTDKRFIMCTLVHARYFYDT